MSDSKAAQLQSLIDLGAVVDSLTEKALKERRNLADALGMVLPAVCKAAGARGGFVRTFSEDLKISLFRFPQDLAVPNQDHVLEQTDEHHRRFITLPVENDVVVAQPLDVAGEWFGTAGLVMPAEMCTPANQGYVAELLNVACEELDNFLFAIRAARQKHRVMMELGSALRNRVLGEGLQHAVKVLCDAVPVERLLLVTSAEEGQTTGSLHVQFYRGQHLEFDTMGDGPAAPPDRHAIIDEARAYLNGQGRQVVERFGLGQAREEVLINGITEASVVGKVLVASSVGGFNTYDRELLAGFAEFIRQRVVDFSKEWRTLARSFRPEDVTRLLHTDGYTQKYLAPREETVAIMYVDIAGFTRISEQILRTPSAVANLVEAWSQEAVELVWKHGGVFDKMVGDCIIALFGPPFYEMNHVLRLQAAIRCACDIRDMTSRLPQRSGFEVLKDSGIAVTAGVNLAPLFVGLFGPNDNFTGFSAGMNNTARLQSCGERNEVLVMAQSLTQLPADHGFNLGPERSAKVKNVAEPLKFRPVLG